MLLQRIVNRLKYDAKEILNFLGVFSLWLVGAFVVVVIVSVAAVYIAFSPDNLGDGYEMAYLDVEDRYIEKDGVVFVTPAIVTLDHTGDFIAGLRLRLEAVQCQNESGEIRNDKKILNERLYFIVDKRNGDVFHFRSSETFNSKLAEFEIDDNIDLNYDRFDIMWNHYNNTYEDTDSYRGRYYQTCVASDDQLPTSFRNKKVVDGVWID